jgi:hypothetical protein
VGISRLMHRASAVPLPDGRGSAIRREPAIALLSRARQQAVLSIFQHPVRSLAVVSLLMLAACQSGPSSPLELTPEAKAYVKNLKLGGVEMKATGSYMAGQLVEITGNITNNGDRELKQVDLNCVFYDPYSQVVLRERVSIVRQKTGALKPQETKSFRLPFDTIPQSWNQQLPQMVIAGILF